MGTLEITLFILLGCLMLLVAVGGMLAIGQLAIDAREADERARTSDAALRRRIERIERLQGMRVV